MWATLEEMVRKGNFATLVLFVVKVLLPCAIFSATCLATPFATQVAGELHSVTGVVSQLFLLHGALHKVEL